MTALEKEQRGGPRFGLSERLCVLPFISWGQILGFMHPITE